MTERSPYSFSSFLKFLNDNFAIIFMVAIAFGSGFFVGSLWTERESLKAGGTVNPSVAGQPTNDVADPAAPQGPTKEQLAKVPPVTDEDHQKGPKNAKITLVEYSDFECPFCKSFSSTMKQIEKEYGDKVRIVFRHYPLPFHPQAQPLAEASECIASLNGPESFWEFHDAVFGLTGQVNASTALDLAEQVGANRQAVQDCMDKDTFLEKITQQMSGGTTTGVNGTPGTVVIAPNGEFDIISGALPFEQVKLIIDKYL